MKNERGLTLVELLAVLVVLSVIMMLIGTVLVNGMKASNRTTTNQQLQQEANYIVEVVRKEYLKSGVVVPIKLEVDKGKFKMDGIIISEGYIYTLESSNSISRTGSSNFNLLIEKNGKYYKVDTILSKLP